jgi:leucine dehydrogenase
MNANDYPPHSEEKPQIRGGFNSMDSVRSGRIVVDSYEISDDLSFSIAYDTLISKLPGNGGIRWMQYATLDQQETEAAVLAERMSEKHSLYNTGFTGAKIVVNGPVNDTNRAILFENLASVLNKHIGPIYTGCDINTTDEDMYALSEYTGFILSSLENSGVDTSVVTAYGVYASLKAALEGEDFGAKTPRIIVHGLGKVGNAISKLAIGDDYHVMGYDKDVEKCNIDGLEAITDEECFHYPCEILVLCSVSGVLTVQKAKAANMKLVISSANAPLSSPSVEAIMEAREIRYIPDVISNAGAVICDSLEHYHPDIYKNLSQDMVNDYVSQLIHSKTLAIMSKSKILQKSMAVVVRSELRFDRYFDQKAA